MMRRGIAGNRIAVEQIVDAWRDELTEFALVGE
jgi:uncharacterized protein (DUF433 family)